MGYLENEFNKRFKDQELPNDQFDADGLWDDIATDLDDAVPPSGPIFFSPKNLGFLFLFALSITALVYFYNQSNPQNNLDSISTNNSNTTTIDDNQTTSNSLSDLSVNDKNSAAHISDTSLSANGNNSTETNSHTSLSADHDISRSMILDSSLSANDKEVKGKTKGSQENAGVTQNSLPKEKFNNNAKPNIPSNAKSNSQNITQTKENKEIDVTSNPSGYASANKVTNDKSKNSYTKNAYDNNTQKNTTATISNEVNESPNMYSNTKMNNTNSESSEEVIEVQKSLSEAKGNTLAESNVKIKLPFLEVLQGTNILLERKEYQKPIFDSSSLSMPHALRTERIKSNYLYISAMTGINAIDYNFKSASNAEIADLKNQAENLYSGSSYGIHVGAQGRKYGIKTGVEYHQLWSEFNYESTNEIPMQLDSVILKEWRDANSGELINAIYGDTIINVTETRTVRHYNNVQRFSIPLQAGIQKKKGKISYGLDLGPVFNFTTGQSGRALALDEIGEIVDFDGTDLPSPFKSFDVSLMVSPSLALSISDDWQIVLNPQWRWSQTKNFADSDFKIGTNQLNFNVGLKYKLSR